MNFANSTYINRSQLADELGVSIATIRNWSKQEGFPEPITKSGKIPICKTVEIISWLEREAKP